MIGSRATVVAVRGCLLSTLAVGLVVSGSLSSAVAAPAGHLTVNTTRDELTPHDGRCSLREAIAALKAPGARTECGTASRGSNTIVLRAGRYRLSIAPVGADDNSSGDLNVTGTAPLTIIGAGPSKTIIDAGGLGDRVLSVSGRARLTLIRLQITGGHSLGAAKGVRCASGGAAGNGGGIFNAGTLTLQYVMVTGNGAGAGGPGGTAGSSGCKGGNGGQGGGVYNRGRLTLVESTVQGNRAGAGKSGGAASPGGLGGNGGGIYNRGRLSVSASTINDNRAGPGGSGDPGGPGGSGGGVFSTGSLRVVNSTLVSNAAGVGGAGGSGGDGGGVAVVTGPSLIRNATLAYNAPGAGGPGAGGLGGGLFVRSLAPADDLRLQNTIVAWNPGSGCAGTSRSAIVNAGHDLSYRDRTCPGAVGNPMLESLKNYGGPTETMALRAGSAAIDGVPHKGSHCPSKDQRGVRRPQGRACDTGAYEFATPHITILAPLRHASYERGSRIRARFRCLEGGIAGAIVTCRGSVPHGQALRTGRVGTKRFVVTATDRSGNRTRKTVSYLIWAYVNPLRAVSGLTPQRIDLGVDYAGSGPVLALGRGRVTMASDTDSGPLSCWAVSCWPGGGIVVYRLLDGPFAGKYVYVAEHITVNVYAGQTVRAGQRIATLHAGSPNSEWGWAAGPGPEALAIADGHRCTCSDPGGWSAIEGRNMNHLLVLLGAPSGYLQAAVPNESMPPGWPTWSG